MQGGRREEDIPDVPGYDAEVFGDLDEENEENEELEEVSGQEEGALVDVEQEEGESAEVVEMREASEEEAHVEEEIAGEGIDERGLLIPDQAADLAHYDAAYRDLWRKKFDAVDQYLAARDNRLAQGKLTKLRNLVPFLPSSLRERQGKPESRERWRKEVSQDFLFGAIYALARLCHKNLLVLLNDTFAHSETGFSLFLNHLDYVARHTSKTSLSSITQVRFFRSLFNE